MNIFFSGIGGVGIGPLAEIAHDAGFTVIGSDQSESLQTARLRERGIAINIGQDGSFLEAEHAATPINWFVYTASLPHNHPELVRARQLGMRTSKRDELLAYILNEKKLKLIAVAGTHGKTTTSGMMTWAFKQLGIPISYSVGSTLSFGPNGKYDPRSEYFIYECDEFDRNFLHFSPHLSLITSLSYDHPDTYPTENDYKTAFAQFLTQSDMTILWQKDADFLDNPSISGWCLQQNEEQEFALAGNHNRRNATLVAKAMEYLLNNQRTSDIQIALNDFPGTDRRFERLADNLYSDYAHHPTEIAATLELALELSKDVVVVYQPHQNRRQYQVRQLYSHCFDGAKHVFWLPTYLTREDPGQEILPPEELYSVASQKENISAAQLDNDLWRAITEARQKNNLVVAMGAGTIDKWLREHLSTE